MDERGVTPDTIEQERQAEIHQGRVWTYLLGVPALGLASMLILIAVLEVLSR
jgi:hypothetical protein